MIDRQEFEELEQLLPFYANGTLDAPDWTRIEQGLAQSAELRQALAEQMEIRSMIKQAGGDWADARTRADAPQPPEGLPQSGSELPQPAERLPAAEVARNPFWFLAPANWGPSIILGPVIVVAAAGLALSAQHRTIRELREENYQLASGRQNPSGKGVIVLELKEEARWSEVAALLGQEGLSVVASGDFGTLVLASKLPPGDVPGQIERLRRSPLVASAEPAA